MTTTDNTAHLTTCSCPACTGATHMSSQGLASSASASAPSLNTQSAGAARLTIASSAPGYVQSLLGTNANMWNDAGSGVPTLGTAATVSYTFSDVSWANPYHYTGGAAFNAARTAAATDAMNMWSNVCNITFTQGSSADAKMSFHTYNLNAGVAGQAATSAYATGSIAQVEVTIDTSSTGNDFNAGGYGYTAMIHEIGHAIGLKHPGNYNAGGGGASGPYLSSFGLTDTRDVSIMSYYAGTYTSGSNPASPMLYDIAAVQALYGANHNYNSGNTTYSISSSSGIITRWDGAGTDTLSSVGYTSNVTLDLREGASYVTHVGSSHSWNAFGANIENATADSGNDTLYGNSLANVLTGGAGNDTLVGGAGDDTLLGGDGTDTYTFVGTGEGRDVLTDSDGAGVIIIDSKTLTGTALNIGLGNYSLTVGTLVFNLSLDGSTLHISKNGGTTVIDATSFTSGEYGITLGTTNTVNGTIGADKMTGTLGSDIMSGNSGNDVITGGTAGADELHGGAGNDTLTTNGNGSSLYGDADVDSLTASGNNSTLDGGDGNDTLSAKGANSVLSGGADNDTMSAIGINSTLDGGAGNDTITASGAGSSVTGGLGVDKIAASAANIYADGGDGNDNMTLSATGSGASVHGGNDDDSVTASLSTGTAYLYGDAGNDTINAGLSTAGVHIDGDAGNDVITGGKGADTITGGTGIDSIVGGSGADSIILQADNEQDYVVYTVLTDGAAAGKVVGFDSISGFESGTDSFVFGSTLENMWDDIGAKNGHIDTTTDGSVNFSTANEGWVITGATDAMLSQANFVDLLTLLNGHSITAVRGSDGLILVQGATLTGIYSYLEDGKASTSIAASELQLIGVANGALTTSDFGGDDAIMSTTVNATIDGGVGNDSITASGIGSVLAGSGGNDTITISANNITADGGEGSDKITIGSTAANATVSGGAGSDSFIIGTSSANAVVNGDDGNDSFTISLIKNSATLSGGAGDDSINASGSSVGLSLSGGADNDTITGSRAIDTIVGGSGSDIITGGAGADSIQLGTDSAADKVVYTITTEGAVAGKVIGYDVITGFESGTDKITFGAAIKTSWDDMGLKDNQLAITTDGNANFTTTNEGWIVTGVADSDLTQVGLANVLAAINSHVVTAAAGNDGLIAVEGTTQTAIFSYIEASTANSVQLNELTLFGVVDTHLATGDFGFL